MYAKYMKNVYLHKNSQSDDKLFTFHFLPYIPRLALFQVTKLLLLSDSGSLCHACIKNKTKK